MEEKPDVDWRKTLTTLVNTAAEDPDLFRAEIGAVAKKIGQTAEEVYTKVQQDKSGVPTRKIGNRIISGVAKRIKRELGV